MAKWNSWGYQKTKSWLEEIVVDSKLFEKNISFQKFVVEVLNDLDLNTVLYFLNYPNGRSVYSACGNRLKGVLQLEESYKVMRDLDFGDRNTVVVGANGCGKHRSPLNCNKLCIKIWES